MTSNAVKYQETKAKNRELDQKAKKLPSEIALMEQQRATSSAQAAKEREEAKYIDKKRSLAGVDSIGNVLAGTGKAAAGIAALANDFAFYTKTGESMLNLLKAATTDQAGRSKQLADLLPIENKAPYMFDTVQDWKPGIYAFDFVPSIGHDLGQMSSTAIAIRKFNTKVRGDNSGSTNYDSVDLFEYPLATDSVAYILAWLERGLDLVNHVESRDLMTLNNRLLIVHCWGRQDLANMFIRNSAGVINIMNKIINTLDALQIPFEIDYIKRHTWLCKKVFRYGDGVSKRYILFRPEIYRVFDEESGSLKAYSFRAAFTHYEEGQSPDTFLDVLQNILTRIVGPLANSQATATMSGDIAKAFGYDGVQFPKYPLNYTDVTQVQFEEDEKYLMSIRNAIISPLSSTQKDDSLFGDELVDLSIRQVINSDLNPVLFMGHLYEEGDSQETCGPSLNKSSVPGLEWIEADDESDIYMVEKTTLNHDVFDYIDYRDTTISEEDQLYNYSFRHDYEKGKTDAGSGTIGVNHCRSEIIVRASLDYSSTSDINTWVTGEFETFMNQGELDAADLNTSECFRLAHTCIENVNFYHKTIGSEKFSPAIYYIFYVEGDGYKEEGAYQHYGWEWMYLIWDRHFNRKVNSAELLDQINYEALVNLFITGGSSNRSKRSNDYKKKPKR